MYNKLRNNQIHVEGTYNITLISYHPQKESHSQMLSFDSKSRDTSLCILEMMIFICITEEKC